MRSVIFKAGARAVAPLLVLVSALLVVRGHNEPGGGFVGGLLCASAFALVALAEGVGAARRLLRIEPLRLVGIGLLVALGSAIPAAIAGFAPFTGLWVSLQLWDKASPVKLGTPLVFDLGVYLTVVGIALAMIFTLEESDDDAPAGL
ncbi:MAG TPA: Na+/H+ antiporter subunit B [Phycisphaerales bacterium]|nr:Na+/H+ antiporter subunit B [Phycisphaerales bacterium]HMP36894.1 Na+/H+ antiporter subunit B [Phycisphaerales bacterium]